MMLILRAKVIANPEAEATLLNAMLCGTKVYNGLVRHLRDEFQRTGENKATRKSLNAVLKTLPRAKEYYSLSVQATRDEAIQAHNSFFALRRSGRTQHQMSGLRRKTKFSPRQRRLLPPKMPLTSVSGVRHLASAWAPFSRGRFEKNLVWMIDRTQGRDII